MMSSLCELHNLQLGSHRGMMRLSNVGSSDIILLILDIPHCHQAFYVLTSTLSRDSVYHLSLPFLTNTKTSPAYQYLTPLWSVL